MSTGIVSLDELKAYLDDTGSSDDGLLTSILAGVCERVENYTGRVFRPVPDLNSGADTNPPVVKSVELPRPPGWWLSQDRVYVAPKVLQIPDVREIETVAFVNATVSGWELVGDRPWRRLRLFGLQIGQPPWTASPSVQITGRFGLWPAPDDLKDAVKAITARRYRERDAGYADSVLLQDGATVNYFKQFSPTVQATLEFYRRRVRLP